MIQFQKRKWHIISAFLGKNKLRIISAFIFGMVANALTILIPVSLGKYFDLLFGFQSHRAAYLDNLSFSFWNDIPQYLQFLTVLIVIRFIFLFIQRFQTEVLGEYFVKDLREQLFRQQLLIQSSVYTERGMGRYLLRHSGDLKSIQNFLTKGVIRFSTDVALLGVAFWVLYFLNTMVFLIVGVGFLVTILGVYFLNKILFHVSVKRRNTRSGLLSFVNHQLQSIKTVKVYNKAFTEVKKYDNRSSKLLKIGIQFQQIYNLIFSIIPSLFYLTLVGVLYYIYLAKQTSAVDFQASNMLAVVFLFITLLPIFRRVIRVSTTWELGNISFDKFSNVFDLASEPVSKKMATYNFQEGRIEFRNVGFHYLVGKPIFENLNFEILPQKNNQIRLGNGEGKSTIIRLLSGLYFPTEGSIEFDSQKNNEVNLKSIRKKITFVSDEFPLLGRTVFEIISYSRNKDKQEKAKEMLDLFQKNNPSHLQLKLTDKVIDGGINLSKSQIKMLQYVRAAISQKPIIVIEEPIRNLEKGTKNNMLKWLKKQQGNKTIILICNTWKSDLNPMENVIEIKSFKDLAIEN